MKEIIDTYHQIKKDIHNRIFEFKSVWNEADEKRLFQELVFCLFTPQSKAVNAWKTVINLTENNKLFEANASSISNDLNLVRFKNNDIATVGALAGFALMMTLDVALG